MPRGLLRQVLACFTFLVGRGRLAIQIEIYYRRPNHGVEVGETHNWGTIRAGLGLQSAESSDNHKNLPNVYILRPQHSLGL